VAINLNDKKEIPQSQIVSLETDDFKLPPGGTSREEDFDLLCHLEIEKEVEEKKGDDDEEEEEEEEEKMAEEDKKFKMTVPSIQNFWLKMAPDEEAFIEEVVKAFESGLDQI